jgi:4-hydroxybenzoate polyprenyltransferase
MKPENIYALSELIRSSTPYGLIIASLMIVLSAISNSDKLVGDRFAYVLGVATGLASAAAGCYGPQQRQQAQTKVDHADQVDIDQSKQ